jgi:hypothetical protein
MARNVKEVLTSLVEGLRSFGVSFFACDPPPPLLQLAPEPAHYVFLLKYYDT